MKLTIKTAKFQEMVAKAVKGASCDKVLPITSMMLIELKDNVLKLVTTDSTNILTIEESKVQGDNFYAVVLVELFSKLIAKTNSESITLNLKENSLEVIGNGVHNIPLPMDEDGYVTFPTYEFDTTDITPQILHLTTVRNILNINKASMNKTIDSPHLCSYYAGDKVITAAENTICFNNLKLFKEPMLIPPQIMELLSLCSVEEINFYRNGDVILFTTPDVLIHGQVHEGIERYEIDEINAHLDIKFESMCKLPKLLLQSVIDRLSLFVEPYDKNGAYFTFTKEGLKITSKQSSSVETISYQESKKFKPYLCCVDIPMFKAHLDANPGEVIELWYGSDAALKIVFGGITQVIALLEDADLAKNGAPVE